MLFSFVPYKVLTGFESVDENPAKGRYHSIKTLRAVFFPWYCVSISGGPLVIQLKYCPVLPSLNKVDYYYYY